MEMPSGGWTGNASNWASKWGNQAGGAMMDGTTSWGAKTSLPDGSWGGRGAGVEGTGWNTGSNQGVSGATKNSWEDVMNNKSVFKFVELISFYMCVSDTSNYSCFSTNIFRTQWRCYKF